MHARDAKRYPVSVLCVLLGVSKQAYYKRDENAGLAKAAQEEFALQYIRQVRAKDPGIGGMKLWHMYRREFAVVRPMGRDRFEDLIDRWGLKVRRRVRAPRTTDSSHGLPTYPNLIRDFIPTAPNQLWVSDITYITVWLSETTYEFCYLSLVMDAYTEEIIGWSVGRTLDTTYPIEALRMALRRIEGVAKEDVNLIHHSDRGCQYASSEYIRLLATNGVRISMTENGDPKENAQAERVNGTMKNELLKGCRFRSVADVKAAVSDAVAFYNNERPHMSIGMMTPAEASNCTGELEKMWKSYRIAAIKKKAQDSGITEKGLPLPQDQRLCPTVNLWQG
ncbi:MAG: IS3 family transposase [Bacteroidales bacterium]|nr:IS3 family transposase [Bacteroidales bacterium]